MSKTPRPITRAALLPNAEGKITKHLYVDTRECTVPGDKGDAWEHLYKCQETGAIRRWGLADRSADAAQDIPETVS